MPQFDFSTYSSQIFWLLFCFGVFYTYIRFFFLPRLDGILSKRNAEIKSTQELIAQNNAQAEENYRNAKESVAKTHELANKVIADAQEKARIAEENALKEVQASQRSAVNEVLQTQKAEFSQEVINKAVIECSAIVLNKIGMNAKKEEIEQILNDIKK
jgi:F-type H+-transporting ATPase subunit b